MLQKFRVARHRFFTYAFSAILTSKVRVGKVTVFALIVGIVLTSIPLLTFFQVRVPQAHASNVSTSLTVLNTPPAWTINAHESVQSSTSTPTNAGSTLTFLATATDSSNDNYWLLICNASSTPIANNNAPPTCGAGALMWARSATTTSGTQASAATTTIATFPFASESNSWYGYICDGNSNGALCNPVQENNDTVNFPTEVSPFVINHPPVFSAIANNSPQNPGSVLTWTATAYDTDTIRGSDTVALYVCKASDFVAGTGCGAGGTWATSTLVSSNPATSTTIVIPTQDNTYNAFVYVVDNYNLVATSTLEASNSSFAVNSVAPSVDPTTIALVRIGGGAGDLTLALPNATSGPFKVQFQVVDNNSCLNHLGGNEISLATTSVYRSGVGQASCQLSGDYNTNSCYPSSNSQTAISCTQDAGSCSGASDSTATWTCTFSLWYNADPTDPGSQYPSQNWLASVQVQAFNGLLSPIQQSTTGNKLDQFLAFNVTQTAIGFGNLQPGQEASPFASTTNLLAYGNVGLNESLYGDTMCTTWTFADSCDAGGFSSSTKIAIWNQEAATSARTYQQVGGVDSADNITVFALTPSTTPRFVPIVVPKTTATASPQTKDTYWGIHVPIVITQSGNYKGQNTITAITSNSAYW